MLFNPLIVRTEFR